MKKKLLIILMIIISFCIGLFMSSVLYRIKNAPLSLCHKIMLTTDEKQEVLSRYKPTKNPFFNIPNWYDKRDLLKTKNFYIQNIPEDSRNANCLTSSNIYSWRDNAFLEFENGDIYRVDCRK